jgi:2-oxo-4-hydroxy-4-carboxy--5-ureidoimidazoline (OHCU) decarboxylase
MFKHYLSEKMRRIIERHPDLAKDVEECIEAVESSFREAFLKLTDASTNNRESFIASHPDGGQMNEQTVQLSDTEAA